MPQFSLPRVGHIKSRRHADPATRAHAKLNQLMGSLKTRDVPAVAQDFMRMVSGQKPTTEVGRTFAILKQTMSGSAIAMYALAINQRRQAIPHEASGFSIGKVLKWLLGPTIPAADKVPFTVPILGGGLRKDPNPFGVPPPIRDFDLMSRPSKDQMDVLQRILDGLRKKTPGD